MKIKISQGASERSSLIQMHDMSVSELYERLAEPAIKRNKNGPYYILASFKSDTRNNSEVQFIYGATVDLDGTDLDMRGIKRKLKHLKCSYVVHTTHSHKTKNKGNRFRVVIPYNAPTPPQEHITFIEYMYNIFEKHGADGAANTLSQPVFWSACSRNTRKHFEFYKSCYSELFSVADMPKAVKHEAWVAAQVKQTAETKTDISKSTHEGSRNNHLSRVVGKLINNGDTKAQVLEYCLELNSIKFTPPLPNKEVGVIVDSIWRVHKKNHGDEQWGYLQIKDAIEKGAVESMGLEHVLSMVAHGGASKTLNSVDTARLLEVLKAPKDGITLNVLKQALTKATEDQKKGADMEGGAEGESVRLELVEKYKRHVFLESSKRIYNRVSRLKVEVEAFDTFNHTLIRDHLGLKTTPFGVLKTYDAIEFVNALRYSPGDEFLFEKNGIKYANMYEAPKWAAREGCIEPLMRHFKYLLPDAGERKVFIDFIAYNLQNPGKKIRWAPILKGKKGIGKSLLCEHLLKPLFGKNNIRPIGDNNVLFEKYNAWKTGSQLVVVQEMSIEESNMKKRQITDTLKSFITDDEVDIREMREAPVTVDNTTNLLAFTNNEDVINITEDERRFCMLRCDADAKRSNYYVRLVKFLKHSMPAVAWFFKDRDLKDFNPNKAPQTQYTMDIKESSRDTFEEMVHNLIEEEKEVLPTCRVIGWKTLHKLLSISEDLVGRQRDSFEQAIIGNTAAGKRLKHALLEKGFRIFCGENGKALRKDLGAAHGGMQYLWVVPSKGPQRSIRKPITPAIKAAEQVDKIASKSEFLR